MLWVGWVLWSYDRVDCLINFLSVFVWAARRLIDIRYSTGFNDKDTFGSKTAFTTAPVWAVYGEGASWGGKTGGKTSGLHFRGVLSTSPDNSTCQAAGTRTVEVRVRRARQAVVSEDCICLICRVEKKYRRQNAKKKKRKRKPISHNSLNWMFNSSGLTFPLEEVSIKWIEQNFVSFWFNLGTRSWLWCCSNRENWDLDESSANRECWGALLNQQTSFRRPVRRRAAACFASRGES